MEQRIGRIVVAHRYNGEPFTKRRYHRPGCPATMRSEPMVQTTEHNPVLVHGGPFANIAHGCNSAIATRMALTFGDYVVTEAGFGADVGAEKFFNIKCRQSGLRPDLTVLVATTLSLKMHGGVPEADITKPNREGIVQGFANLDKHIEKPAIFRPNCGLVVLNCFKCAILMKK